MTDQATTLYTIAVFFLLALLLAATLYALRRTPVSVDSAHIGAPLGFLSLLCLLIGAIVGSSPVVYPYLAKGWDKIGFNINDVRPLLAAKRGTDFEYDEATRTIKFLKAPDDCLWVVKHDGEREIVEGDKYELPASADPKLYQVYFQNMVDGRTSSSVPVKR